MWFYDKILFYIKLLSSKEKELYLFLYQLLGFCPHNLQLYKQAFCHRSHAKKHPDEKNLDNERLEFLGDAILNAVVSDMLYKKFSKGKEGFLSNTRSKIVQRESLNRLADETGLIKQLKYSCPAHSHNCYMGGNAVEALIGAVYLDRGYTCCRSFIEQRLIKPHINVNSLARKVINFKSKLLEWCQKNKIEINYELISSKRDSEGCEIFCSSVIIGGIEREQGKGYTKKESQQEASRKILIKINNSEEFRNSLLSSAIQK